MKKTLIIITVAAVCAVGACAYAFADSEPNKATAKATTTVPTETSIAPTTLQQTTCISDGKPTKTTTAPITTRRATASQHSTTRKSDEELLEEIKNEYDIDGSYILTKKTYNNGTEYYWEWVDENGYRNMSDALRVHIENGKITLIKRFDNKARQGVIAVSKSEAIEFAGGGKVTDILYYLNDDMNKPRLSYKIVNGKCITYIDTENCDVLGGDMIK